MDKRRLGDIEQFLTTSSISPTLLKQLSGIVKVAEECLDRDDRVGADRAAEELESLVDHLAHRHRDAYLDLVRAARWGQAK